MTECYPSPNLGLSLGHQFVEKRRRDDGDAAAAAAHYPLATAAIVCTRSVLALLGVCVPITGRELPFATTAASHWHLVASEKGLLDLACLLVRLVDDEYDHQKCNYMTFPAALRAAEARFAQLLREHARDCAGVPELAKRVAWKCWRIIM